MDKNYKKYEIPPMWDYSPHEDMMYIDSIFKPSVFTLTGSCQYKLEPSAIPFVVMGSVTFYHCELFTNELEIVPVGPIRIEFPYGDDEGVPVQNHVGRIKSGRKLFISPAFLTRYCLPSNKYEYSQSDLSELKSKLYPKHKSEADLTLLGKMVSGYAESHNPIYIILDKKVYMLESVVEPISPDERMINFSFGKYLFNKNRVDPHDYPVIFTRHDITEDDMLEGMKDCYAICLLSELYDMAEINKKE